MSDRCGFTHRFVPREQVRALAETFRAAGAAVELKEQRASHGLVQSDIFDVRDWLARVTQRQPRSFEGPIPR